jgi:hypothetical protein
MTAIIPTDSRRNAEIAEVRADAGLPAETENLQDRVPLTADIIARRGNRFSSECPVSAAPLVA